MARDRHPGVGPMTIFCTSGSSISCREFVEGLFDAFINLNKLSVDIVAYRCTEAQVIC